MKTKIFKSFFFILFFLLLLACSTKKDTFLSRNSHALSTRDNILYNGRVGFDKGIISIRERNKDNFWKQLPVEKMNIVDVSTEESSKNADFELAEAKATKAIQKHSMNIDGRERNYQIDEAYLLLGKARYFDQRFFPALEAFNYILYKYPTSSNISEAKIWREKTNMRLGNDAQVIKNITKLLEQKKLKRQIVADANALLSESFLNLGQKDSAIVKLKIAEKNTKLNPERTRYRFILGQLYQEMGIRDTALIYYQAVINMNRKAEREYLIQAYAKKAQLFDFQNGDTIAFLKKYNSLLKDRENRPFKDIINHQIGVFYDKKENQAQAIKFYNSSLKSSPTDDYLIASNYRNLGNMSFKNADYSMAAKYYDSTLVKLDDKTREYIHIKKVRNDLDEVINFESIAKVNDSILKVVAMSDADKILYYENHIVKLKAEDEKARLLEEKQKEIQKNIDINNSASNDDVATGVLKDGKSTQNTLIGSPTGKVFQGNNAVSTFYFYNPSTVAFGKLDFKKKWGNRTLDGNWRLSSTTQTDVAENESETIENETTQTKIVEIEKPQYSPEFYIGKLPDSQYKIDSIAKERNFVYYQLGVIYKEKFKEYKLASTKLEQLLTQNPEEKLVLPSLYNLYKIYQIIDEAKAAEVKNLISSKYPDSRYAQIINNQESNTFSESESSEMEYSKWFKLFEDGQLVLVLENIDDLIIKYYGEEIAPKFELLKANTIGKLKGVYEYKRALQFVADTYPTSEEGKKAQEIVYTQIQLLEQLNFTNDESKNWKIIYKVGKKEDKNTKALEDKINKYITDEKRTYLSYSYDVYTEKENFITIKGTRSQPSAVDVAYTLKKDKKYNVLEPSIIISSENYSVVQIKKNLEEYLKIIETGVYPDKVPVAEPFDQDSSGAMNPNGQRTQRTQEDPASVTDDNTNSPVEEVETNSEDPVVPEEEVAPNNENDVNPDETSPPTE